MVIVSTRTLIAIGTLKCHSKVHEKFDSPYYAKLCILHMSGNQQHGGALAEPQGLVTPQ